MYCSLLIHRYVLIFNLKLIALNISFISDTLSGIQSDSCIKKKRWIQPNLSASQAKYENSAKKLPLIIIKQSICLSVNLYVCLCTNWRLNGKFYDSKFSMEILQRWSKITLKRLFFKNRSDFLKIQILSDFFLELFW